MVGTLLRIIGVALIVVPVAGFWMLDRFGCAMNTMGCSSVFPRFTLEVLIYLAIPVSLGVFLFIKGGKI